jgi:protein disulfide-isomerase A1
MTPSVAVGTNGKGYKWLFLGLLTILLVVFIVAFVRAKKEGFEGGAATVFYFFMPQCGHCQKFNPEWERLQKMVDEKRAPLKLKKVDGTDDANSALVQQHDVKGFPTILMEVGNKSVAYSGQRDADAIYDWAMSSME